MVAKSQFDTAENGLPEVELLVFIDFDELVMTNVSAIPGPRQTSDRRTLRSGFDPRANPDFYERGANRTETM